MRSPLLQPLVLCERYDTNTTALRSVLPSYGFMGNHACPLSSLRRRTARSLAQVVYDTWNVINGNDMVPLSPK